MKNTKNKIIVAMSGGVDSSVAAAIMAKEGFDVIGVTLQLLTRGATGFGCCGSPEDMSIAKRSAEKIGIPHYVLDYSQDFDKNVIGYFVDSYLDGETPNPCVACNRYIKFDRLDKFAQSLGAARLVTGHYARIEDGPDGKRRLFKAQDENKDQSYVLHNITQEALKTTEFPLGRFTKPQIRQLAKDFDLPNADKAESQEICFVPNRDYGAFVKNKLKEDKRNIPLSAQPGIIRDTTGKEIGQHKGVAFYTIGQRKGLGLTTTEPYYVVALDSQTNTLVVGPDHAGYSPGLDAVDLSWISGSPPDSQFEADVKIRYKHDPAPAVITVKGDKAQVRFKENQKAVTPGQIAVFYKWDPIHKAPEVLGGGKIVEAHS